MLQPQNASVSAFGYKSPGIPAPAPDIKSELNVEVSDTYLPAGRQPKLNSITKAGYKKYFNS